MSSDPNAGIARRTASGSLYSIAASSVTILLGFLRSVLLLRLLLPEHFGVVTLALFYLNLVAQLFGFGFDNTFIHRQDAANAGRIRGVYFTLRTGAALLTLLVLALLLPLLRVAHPADPLLTPVLLALMLFTLLRGLNMSQVTILTKEMAFRQLAITDVICSVVMTLVAPTMAWLGYGVWSLVGEQLSGAITRFFLVNVHYRAWVPRPAWDWPIVRSFFHFGNRLWVSSSLDFALDRFDDWFVGSFLGSTALGYYSRAYEYAHYPRRVIANPILSVFFPAFARLQDDRLRLSRAFFRATSLMVRTGGLFTLLFVFTAPEFTPLLLGERWLPMVPTFQLMVIYTFLDPLALAASNLLVAAGHPGVLMRTRIVQMLIFVPAAVVLGLWQDIAGVAVAADIMALVGALILFRHSHRVTTYSARALWFWPLVAMLAISLLLIFTGPLWQPLPLWSRFLLKCAFIPPLYGLLLWLTEREQLLSGMQMLWGLLPSHWRTRLQRNRPDQTG